MSDSPHRMWTRAVFTDDTKFVSLDAIRPTPRSPYTSVDHKYVNGIAIGDPSLPNRPRAVVVSKNGEKRALDDAEIMMSSDGMHRQSKPVNKISPTNINISPTNPKAGISPKYRLAVQQKRRCLTPRPSRYAPPPPEQPARDRKHQQAELLKCSNCVEKMDQVEEQKKRSERLNHEKGHERLNHEKRHERLERSHEAQLLERPRARSPALMQSEQIANQLRSNLKKTLEAASPAPQSRPGRANSKARERINDRRQRHLQLPKIEKPNRFSTILMGLRDLTAKLILLALSLWLISWIFQLNFAKLFLATGCPPKPCKSMWALWTEAFFKLLH